MHGMRFLYWSSSLARWQIISQTVRPSLKTRQHTTYTTFTKKKSQQRQNADTQNITYTQSEFNVRCMYFFVVRKGKTWRRKWYISSWSSSLVSSREKKSELENIFPNWLDLTQEDEQVKKSCITTLNSVYYICTKSMLCGYLHFKNLYKLYMVNDIRRRICTA